MLQWRMWLPTRGFGMAVLMSGRSEVASAQRCGSVTHTPPSTSPAADPRPEREDLGDNTDQREAATFLKIRAGSPFARGSHLILEEDREQLIVCVFALPQRKVRRID